jgi:hypothetical protein
MRTIAHKAVSPAAGRLWGRRALESLDAPKLGSRFVALRRRKSLWCGLRPPGSAGEYELLFQPPMAELRLGYGSARGPLQHRLLPWL